MSWGNPEPVAAAPIATICEYPNCREHAAVFIDIGTTNLPNKVASCVNHALAQEPIVGLVEGNTVAISEAITKKLVAQHEHAKATLEAAKNSEMEARLMIGNYAFPVAGRKEGVNNLELSDGRTVKLGHKVNYKLAGDNEKIEKVEEACEKIGNEGVFLIERIITWEAKFSKSEYNKLEADNPTHVKVKAEIDKVLEVSNGTPSLEVKEPKAKLNNQ